MRFFHHCPSLRRALLKGHEPLWLQNHPRRQYVKAAVMATPPWSSLSQDAFFKLQNQRDFLSWLIGTEHVLDHIIPLTHPSVCGLNVPWNIQVIPYRVNAVKSNKWSPDQLDWLYEHGQFSKLRLGKKETLEALQGPLQKLLVPTNIQQTSRTISSRAEMQLRQKRLVD